jgi:hypothetical protein
MKPRIALRGRYYWCGTEMQKWMCSGRYRTAFGPTPEQAYDAWAKLTNIDKVDGL